jgi:DNA-binding IclR family transcriptional regulator
MFNTRNRSPAPAPALSRGLSILELLAESKRGLTLSEISRRLELAKSSTYHLLKCLEGRGYIHCSGRTGRYLFSLKLLRLSHLALHALKLLEGTSALLRALVQETNLTVHLAILEDNEAILIDKVEPRAASRIATWLGRRMELHCTGIGKVLLAWLPEARFDRLIAEVGLPRHNENTIASARKLREHLKTVRSLGYAVDDEEDEVGFRCVAAPIFEDSGMATAAVSVVGTTDEITPQRLPELANKVKATAAAISETLQAGSEEER